MIATHNMVQGGYVGEVKLPLYSEDGLLHKGRHTLRVRKCELACARAWQVHVGGVPESVEVQHTYASMRKLESVRLH